MSHDKIGPKEQRQRELRDLKYGPKKSRKPSASDLRGKIARIKPSAPRSGGRGR